MRVLAANKEKQEAVNELTGVDGREHLVFGEYQGYGQGKQEQGKGDGHPGGGRQLDLLYKYPGKKKEGQQCRINDLGFKKGKRTDERPESYKK